MRFRGALWVPWRYDSESGPTYYRGENRPVAIIVHIMQGHGNAAREWALGGHYGASWHGTIYRDGRRLQHLEERDGGYHAGIPATAPSPTWPLWRGHGQNVNRYTIGLEHEGFTGEPWPAAQIEASAEFAAFWCELLGIPADRKHIVGHCEIDLVNRRDDPGRNFPWDQYIELVEGYMGITEERLQQILAEREAKQQAAEIRALGSTQIEATAALVRRQRAMGRATSLDDIIRANDPAEVPQ